MILNNAFKQEILEEMTKIFPGSSRNEINDFSILQGADTITYSFTLIQEEIKRDLILRIFREISDRAEDEFLAQHALSLANIAVPKPFCWKKESPIISKSYIVMEKIPGNILADCFIACENEDERNDLVNLFIKELVNIHNLNLKKFPFLGGDYLQDNPFAFVDRKLYRPMELVKFYDIAELIPLLEWLEKNKKRTNRLSLIHGDYHMNNVILTPKKDISIVDWSSIQFGDNRYDLAFSIVATSSLGMDVTKQFTSIYEDFSRERVENIEYFKVLSILNYILRCYSAIINPQITNENKTTKDMFLRVYKIYTKYIVEIVEKITGTELSILEKELS